VAPAAAQRAALQKDYTAYARPVVDREFLDIEHNALCHIALSGTFFARILRDAAIIAQYYR
jgi:hypothetical protein